MCAGVFGETEKNKYEGTKAAKSLMSGTNDVSLGDYAEDFGFYSKHRKTTQEVRRESNDARKPL